jgi:hypothetical protein
MLEICFGTYLVLGLLAMVLLWMTLAVSKMRRESDRQRHYQISLAATNLKNARGK